MVDFLYVVLALACVAIVFLLCERDHYRRLAESMQHSRNFFRTKNQEERFAVERLEFELQQLRDELDTVKGEKRSAGIALGLIDPIEEVDEIPF